MNKHLSKLFSVTLVLALMMSMLSVIGTAEAAPELFANPTTTIFINEIHYDNTGTDSGESVEVAGPAGTDLTGWSIVLYNGSNSLAYDTDALSGVIADQQGGYGTVVLAYPSNGIQNGVPDGIALVDATSTVVQFLSYEGTITALDGPAIGMLSTDIGVSENGSGAVGNSLQLTGSGTTYGDFTWTGEQANTFGTVNTGQTFSGGPAADPVLVINEIDYDQPSTDFAEFVEIKNVGTVSANLSEFTLELVNGTGGGAAVYQSYVLPAVTLAAGDYFVVCGDAANVANCDLDVTPDSNLVQNGAPDAVGLRRNGTLVDAVSYEGNSGVPYTEGSGVGLEDNPSVENAGISRFPDGTDTDQNNVDLSLRCSTPGEANVAESSNCVLPNTDLVINEIDYDQPSTDAAEFVEIRNNGDTPADLTGWTLEFINGTGGGAATYDTIILPAVSLASGDYFVVCANAATVANCDLDDGPDTNFIQNGAPDAVALSFNGNLIDTVSYEGDTGAPYTEGSGAGLEDAGVDGSISRCPDGVDTDQNNVDFVFTGTITPGAENSCGGGGPVPQEVKIHEVQGNGSSVAITGAVTVEAIVVADYQADGQLSGFFLQEEDGDADTDAATSEGIFVYCGPCATDVSVGDLVEVTGVAEEYFGMSQIDVTGSGTVMVVSSGNPLPTAATIDLPASGSTEAESTFESLEGMVVTFTDELVVSEYFELARYGQLVLTADARPSQFTDANEPSVSGYAAFLDDLNSKRIILDDDNNIQNDAIEVGPDEPYYWPRPGLSITNFVRGGDSITGLTGVLHWSFAGQRGTDAWRVRPVEEAFTYDFTSNNERTTAPDDVDGSLKVASFNVLNYFTTLDSRGADSVAELDRQREKTAAAICAMDADIVGLIEIENNAPVAISDLLNGSNGINANCGPYDFINTGVIGTDQIAVAFIYRPATVSTVGDFAILDSSVDPRFNDDKNRPALAQTFQDDTTGGIFTVVVNHLKSKGSACTDVGDPDVLDGQGNCNLTRKAAAEAMVDWLATDPTGSGDDDFLIMGDLNSYRNEDPIDAIEEGADDMLGTSDDYTDLLDALIGPSAYSYVFDGQLGYLDHALASSDLLGEVTGVTVWHINADEIPVFDYNDDIDDGSAEASFERESSALPIYEPNAYRASDHDPVIIGLDVCDEIAPTFDTLSVTPNVLWNPNHKYVNVTATVNVSDNFDPNPTITLLSVTSNEPDDGEDDGNTVNDIVIVDDFHFELRAERSGVGTGRVYTITYQVTDACGNSTIASVTVTVPLSQGN